MYTLDLYELKMSLFDNGEPEDFLLFVCNFITTLAVSVTLEAGKKYKYFSNLVREEALRQIYLLSADVEGTETPNVDYIIRVYPSTSLL